VLLTLALIVLGLSSAPAQPRIPSSEMPGRERERFVDSPFERYRKPRLQIKLQSTDPPAAAFRGARRSHRLHRPAAPT
jgi:hypothetical protein